MFDVLVNLLQGKRNVPIGAIAYIVAVKTGNPQGLEVGADNIGRHVRVRDSTAQQVIEGLGVGVVERDAEGLGLTYDLAGHEHVNLAGAPRRGAFSTALVQVQIAGVDAEAVEQISPELLVVTRFSRRPVFRFPLLNVGKPPEFELGEIVTNGSAVKNSRRGHNHQAYKPTHLLPAKAGALDHFPTAGAVNRLRKMQYTGHSPCYFAWFPAFPPTLARPQEQQSEQW